MCGKVNKELESMDDSLNIEIPYFVYGLEENEFNNLLTFNCEFNDLTFNLHCQF